ncbi:hypothetical protein [Jeongeupia naejangsanensis]|uniref:Uncharacterized protein n=1 Tax=Jeongeupia naejangsanensis TaxID=613195 RepID=A0ABS2BMT6_9NEIS|nr:hypothetical protein [Jeongeupia naejangsanensis]MBM3116936.1 hypothetical protein [Jeongeupia naejangsanensis]
MPIVVRAFPLLQPVEAMNAFIAALAGERKQEAEQFFRHYGVSHESWHLQETGNGPWVIAISMVDDPAAAAACYANASEEFHCWFRAQVQQLSGVDPQQAPLGPPTTCVFNWFDGERLGSNLCG